MSKPKQSERLDAWWSSLTVEQQHEVLSLSDGERIPSDYLTGMVAHGLILSGASWDVEVGITVDRRLARFLERQRRDRRHA